MNREKEKITKQKGFDNKIELSVLLNSFESSEKKNILEIVKLMVKSVKFLNESLNNCAGLAINRSKYAKYLFLNENLNEEFDRENFNDIYPSTDIFFPQAIFRYHLEREIRRVNSNRSINDSIFRIVLRFVLSLDSVFNHPYRSYFTEETAADNIVPENIRHLIRQHNADLIDKLYEKLIEYDKEHFILTDLFNKKEIYKGRVMGDRCLGLKLKELKQNKLDSDKKAEIEAGFRPDENPCDDTKELNYLREMNVRKCFEDETGLNYLSEEYCDYFNEMYRVHIEKLPPTNNGAKINKDVDYRLNHKKEALNVIHNQEKNDNEFNFHEADKTSVFHEQKLNEKPIILRNSLLNSATTSQKVISYDQKYREYFSTNTSDANSILKIFVFIFPIVLLFYFIYIVIKRRQMLNK